jgi:hypothetical protein
VESLVADLPAIRHSGRQLQAGQSAEFATAKKVNVSLKGGEYL